MYLVIFINIASLIIVVTLTNASDSSVIVLGVLVGVLHVYSTNGQYCHHHFPDTIC